MAKKIGGRLHELLDEGLNGKRLQDSATKLLELIVDADKLMQHTRARIVRYGYNAEQNLVEDVHAFEQGPTMNVKSLRVFFFDVDGVLWVGKENPRYVGGKEVVEKLKHSGKKTFVLTNDSTHVREEIHQNLTKLGFSFAVEEILTSSYLTARYLSERFGKASFYLVGEDGIKRELEAAGHYASTEPEAVVVGLDRQLTYEKLDDALRLLRSGARLVGSYGGAVYMGDRGPALSAGPVIKALEFASGRRAVMIGKPSPRMFTLALQLANEKAGRAVMVGDQIETDVVGARKAGVHTILVLTGVETRESVGRSKIKPDVTIDNLEALGSLL